MGACPMTLIPSPSPSAKPPRPATTWPRSWTSWSREGTDRPHPDAQGSSLHSAPHNARRCALISHAYHPLVRGVLAALLVSADVQSLRPGEPVRSVSLASVGRARTNLVGYADGGSSLAWRLV